MKPTACPAQSSQVILPPLPDILINFGFQVKASAEAPTAVLYFVITSNRFP